MGAPWALTLIASEFSLCTAMLEFVKLGLGFRIQDTPKLFMWDSVNQAECMIESMSAFPQLLLLLYTITAAVSSPQLYLTVPAFLCRRCQAPKRIRIELFHCILTAPVFQYAVEAPSLPPALRYTRWLLLYYAVAARLWSESSHSPTA